jgi:hypothetical protein
MLANIHTAQARFTRSNISGLVIDNLGVVILLPAVETDFNFPLRSCKVPLQNIVKIDDLPIGIVNDFNPRRFLSEKYRGPSAKRLAIDMMVWDHTQNLRSKLLFPP